ncbi:hypothetical protein F5B18DRAFT_334743 [Nemania serpens]|nr:hypothetical protein F5B18DRAFT_334743 [Nemania serpens]
MSFDSTIPSIQKPSADVQSIWGAAVAQYEKLTGVHLDHLKKPKTFDEIWSELSQTQSSFQNVRSNGGKYDKLRSKVARSLGPISLVGDIVAHATKAAYPPSEAIFAAVRYLISSANAVSGDYDTIESFFDELQTELNSLKILESQITLVPELEVALTEVFSSVLVLCGICVKYIRKKRLGKALQALASGRDADLKDAQEVFRQKVRKVHNIVRNATLSRVVGLGGDTSALQTNVTKGLAITERIDSNMNSFLQNTSQLLDHIERQEIANERDNILKWLSPVSFHDKQRAVFEKHYGDTGQWLLSCDTFQAWFSGNAVTPLWCPGIPGAGKTVMVYEFLAFFFK